MYLNNSKYIQIILNAFIWTFKALYRALVSLRIPQTALMSCALLHSSGSLVISPAPAFWCEVSEGGETIETKEDSISSDLRGLGPLGES